LTDVNGTLFFRAEDGVGVHGVELWKSDGTADGTLLVKDINLWTISSEPETLTDVNGTLFFGARDGVHGSELWALNVVTFIHLPVIQK
jgi:ELWxxDGT repeat protein